jgi:uncharacterized protein YbaP (TraB family)
MRFLPSSCILILLVLAASVPAEPLIAPECEVLELTEERMPDQSVYGKGLLWRVSKKESVPSYVFGTIHVADESITELPAQVVDALNRSRLFAMEVLPDPAASNSYARLMYFADGRKLIDLVSGQLFDEIVRLMGAYHLPKVAVVSLKPWAAFLIMSYPNESGQILDMRLLELARQNGADVRGLETLREQVDIFDTMTLDKQLQLLSDTACHHELIEADFELMKSLYLARDLAGLYSYGQRISNSDDELYNELTQKLLIDRNYTMVERMEKLLQSGNAFIAIGAMHLVGEEGILALLEINDYKISRVY